MSKNRNGAKKQPETEKAEPQVEMPIPAWDEKFIAGLKAESEEWRKNIPAMGEETTADDEMPISNERAMRILNDDIRKAESEMEYKVRLFVDGMRGKTMASPDEARRAFQLYYEITGLREKDTCCSTCVIRAFGRLKLYLKDYDAKKTK